MPKCFHRSRLWIKAGPPVLEEARNVRSSLLEKVLPSTGAVCRSAKQAATTPTKRHKWEALEKPIYITLKNNGTEIRKLDGDTRHT